MTGYVSRYLEAPCRSLVDLRRELRGQRITLLHRQMEAVRADRHAEAADCLRRIADVEAKLRVIEEEGRG